MHVLYRGAGSPGWEGVDLIDESKFLFASQVPKTIVWGDINEYAEAMKALEPDYIWSLGWQQIFRKKMFEICPIIGIHESLLPEGAGAVPIANTILHGKPQTGVTLFELDKGVDSCPIIGQLVGKLDPRKASATALYNEAMFLEEKLIKTFVPLLRENIASRIPQDMARRTVYEKIIWEAWPEERVKRARTYPYK